jgi:hypothetical protein
VRDGKIVIAAVLRPGGTFRDSRGARDGDTRNGLQYFLLKPVLVLKLDI